jgi:hypothetical protein
MVQLQFYIRPVFENVSSLSAAKAAGRLSPFEPAGLPLPPMPSERFECARLSGHSNKRDKATAGKFLAIPAMAHCFTVSGH